jgi:hypothetical protein
MGFAETTDLQPPQNSRGARERIRRMRCSTSLAWEDSVGLTLVLILRDAARRIIDIISLTGAERICRETESTMVAKAQLRYCADLLNIWTRCEERCEATR